MEYEAAMTILQSTETKVKTESMAQVCKVSIQHEIFLICLTAFTQYKQPSPQKI